jgi:hypothetical protein
MVPSSGHNTEEEIMLLLILVLLLALSTILVGAPSWKSPPVGVGMALAAISAVVCTRVRA